MADISEIYQKKALCQIVQLSNNEIEEQQDPIIKSNKRISDLLNKRNLEKGSARRRPIVKSKHIIKLIKQI